VTSFDSPGMEILVPLNAEELKIIEEETGGAPLRIFPHVLVVKIEKPFEEAQFSLLTSILEKHLHQPYPVATSNNNNKINFILKN